jgi:hypothetical protein
LPCAARRRALPPFEAPKGQEKGNTPKSARFRGVSAVEAFHPSDR